MFSFILVSNSFSHEPLIARFIFCPLCYKMHRNSHAHAVNARRGPISLFNPYSFQNTIPSFPVFPVFPVLSSLLWYCFHLGLYMTLYHKLSDHPLPWQLPANIYQAKLGPDSLNHTLGSVRYCCSQWMVMIVQYSMCMRSVCARVGKKELNLTLQCFGDYRNMPALRASSKDNDACFLGFLFYTSGLWHLCEMPFKRHIFFTVCSYHLHWADS